VMSIWGGGVEMDEGSFERISTLTVTLCGLSYYLD
jgi:hypothetical protein